MNIKKLFFHLILIVILAGMTDCAKMGSLVGGPRDEDPPKVISSTPENYSTRFSGKKIEITFDEFIQLNNVNQELVVSPPIGTKPDVKLKNKTILIELEEELRENTTYTLNFGAALKDNNEGNPLTNFEFVFSTGEYLDSLSIGGTLLNAFDLKPSEEPVMIMLYDNLYDSVVFKEIPVYVGKSEKKGEYRINNLKADTFKLFALKDVNNNFLFDLPNELIAFLDTTIIIDPEFFSKIAESEKDSLLNDSIGNIFPDTVTNLPVVGRLNIAGPDTSLTMVLDSIETRKINTAPDRILVDMFLFTEKTEIQFLSNYARKVRNKLDFNFSLPVTDSFHFQPLLPETNEWYLQEVSQNRDTFSLWIINEEVRQMDSILLELNYVIKDSLKRDAWKKDTLLFTFREPARSDRKKSSEEKEEVPVMMLDAFKKNATIELNQKASFISQTPVNYIDTSFIRFFIIKDTLELREPYSIFKDSLNYRKILFDKKWEPGAKYRFAAYPGAFMDVYGATPDTIDVIFSVRKEDYYGVLLATVENVIGPVVVQLLDTRETVLKEKKVNESGEIRFEFLKPGKYKVKIIHDRNGNGKWDTGKYILGIQPEKVEYLRGEQEIRANWELKINIPLKN